jgi:hypothetical protein
VNDTANRISRILALVTALLLAPLAGLHAQEHWTYLDNGKVRLGANMDAGGACGWFSHSRSSDNVLNTYDHGRYLQQSYYGDTDWNGKPRKVTLSLAPLERMFRYATIEPNSKVGISFAASLCSARG